MLEAAVRHDVPAIMLHQFIAYSHEGPVIMAGLAQPVQQQLSVQLFLLHISLLKAARLRCVPRKLRSGHVDDSC